MERRKFLKAAGAASIGATLAGCMGDSSGASDQTETDAGDETVNGGDPGWFDIDSNVLEERMGQEVTITQSSLFRTAQNFGVRFTAKNKGGAPLTNMTVHARLRGAEDSVIDTFETSLTEEESIDDLGTNETWQGDIVFEGTSTDVFLDDVVAYDIWATGQAEQTGAGAQNGSSGNGTTQNGTLGGETTGNGAASTATGGNGSDG